MSKELESRNRAMYQLYAKGTSIQAVADTFQITRQRAAQIIARYGSDASVTDSEARNLHRAQLAGIMDDLVGMYYEPPPVTFDVKGNMLRDENGEPVRDVEIKLKTAKEVIRISETIRRMDATDEPRRRQLAEDEAIRAVKEFLSGLPQGEVE